MPSLPKAATAAFLLLLASSLPSSHDVPRAARTRVARHRARPQPVVESVAAAVPVPVAAAAAATAASTVTTAAALTTPTHTTSPPSLYPPVLIVLNTPHYFGDEYGRANFTCTVPGVNVVSEPWHRFQCTFSGATEIAESADALWYHLPTTSHTGPYNGSFRFRPDQVTIAATMESAAYYPTLNDPAYMSRFDIEASYRMSADVVLSYYNDGYAEKWATTPPVPYAEKLPAVAYLSSNCGAPSGRDTIAGQLMNVTGGLPVHALGACRNNKPSPPSRQQVDTLKNYRFCIAMENSIADDYVSEKVYAALVAGCTPIYYGPPNAADFVPSPKAIIDWRRFNGSADALMAELVRLNSDETAYSESQAWRQADAGWSPAFKALRAKLAVEETQCHMCRLVAEKRAAGWRKDN